MKANLALRECGSNACESYPIQPRLKLKRSKTQLANHTILQEWTASGQPSWLTAEFYEGKIQPLVSALSNGMIVRSLSVSRGYANQIRRGGRVPDPRYWVVLAKLTAASG